MNVIVFYGFKFQLQSKKTNHGQKDGTWCLSFRMVDWIETQYTTTTTMKTTYTVPIKL